MQSLKHTLGSILKDSAEKSVKKKEIYILNRPEKSAKEEREKEGDS